MSKATDFNEASHGNMTTYIVGYGLSLGLTGTAFWLVHKHILSNHAFPTDTFMFWALASLALVQLFVQLIFFFHLDRESKPRWNRTAMAFAAIVVIILVGGSIWIMTNLNYHHFGFGHDQHGHTLTTPSQTNQYIIKEEGIQP